MGTFDQFGQGQATNGLPLQNPQATSGAPGFNFGGWGNLPPNLAGGIQQFMAARNMAPGMGKMFGGGPGAPFDPQKGMASGLPQQGPTMPQQGAPMQSGSAMPMGQDAAGGTVPSPQGAAPGLGLPQQGQDKMAGFAGGMRPYLGG
jgi:hypothetical protein